MAGLWMCSHGWAVGVQPWLGCGCAAMAGLWVCSHGWAVGVQPWLGCGCAAMAAGQQSSGGRFSNLKQK